MLRALGEELWVAEAPLRLMAVQFGVRASVVRLGDGGLWVHCPIGLSDGLEAELAALGPVRHLVAANRHHHLYLVENARAFPEAQVRLAPGLAEKTPALPGGVVLGGETPWADDLDQLLIEGWPFASETVFLHRRSRTLLLTDLAFNLREPRPPVERWMLRLLGAYDRLGPSRLARGTMRDRAKVRASVDRVLGWDFERVVPAHGEIVEKGGRELLREAFAFL